MEFEPFVAERIVEESIGVKSFLLTPRGGKLPAYKPGNFFLLMLSGDDGRRIFRPYSATSHPDEPGLRFCVKKNGVFTELLWKLCEGDGIDVDGPHGLFTLAESDAERVFIAGGIGITPLRGMILQTIKEGKKGSLFHCARTVPELTFRSEMEGLASDGNGFAFYPSLTRDEPPRGWKGTKGRVSAQGIRETLGTLEGKAFYICGSREMAADLASALVSEGVKKEKVRKEEWG